VSITTEEAARGEKRNIFNVEVEVEVGDGIHFFLQARSFFTDSNLYCHESAH
jgi:hypothetical protein